MTSSAPLGGARRLGLVAAALASLLLVAPASAAAAPAVEEVWASSVSIGSARLSVRINPGGLSSGYHVDYIEKAAYDANVAAAKDPFAGALRSPSGSDANIGSGAAPVTTFQTPFGLAAGTAYRYRVVAKNSSGTTVSATFAFVTRPSGGAGLPDGRAWELVSPVAKNGGEVDPPGALAGGGVLQAAADGQAVTYGSAASFAGGAGAAPGSQYVAARTAAGWSTANITAPLYSGSYGSGDEGVPYQLFSGDLGRALLLNGRRCRGEGTDCAVPNPPLAGTDAPAGYQNYYLRESGSFTALLGSANSGFLDEEPRDFELRLAGASPDLRQVVLSTCAALTADATEVPLGAGCDPAQPNLYRHSPAAGLTLVNVLPAQSTGTPGATLAAQSGAVSADGSRVYFVQGGSLYLREGVTTKQVDTAAGGGGSFATAAADGTVAFFTKGGHLWRYQAAGAGSATDLTPGGGVIGVLGASASGSHVYYLTGSGLFLWNGGAPIAVAATADASNLPPATGTARVSADGTKLLFLATAPLSDYDNEDLNTGLPDTQVYLYDAGAAALTCVSCNPTLGRPIGPSTIPGAIANGSAPGSTHAYKPRVLSADGKRVFFNSVDAIGVADTNKEPDVYQWEAGGTGSCAQAGGCVSLISSGKSEDGARFVDASASGDDAFFLTDGSLVSADPGAADLYDARVGGGFPVPNPPIACLGDACQPLPPEPVDPTLTTLLSGPGNPAVRYPKASRKCKKSQVKRKGKCVKRKTGKAGGTKKRAQRGGSR